MLPTGTYSVALARFSNVLFSEIETGVELFTMREVRFAHCLNAYFPMLVTFEGIVTEGSNVHSKNAPSPMLSTLEGIVTEVRFVQSSYLQTALFQLFTC